MDLATKILSMTKDIRKIRALASQFPLFHSYLARNSCYRSRMDDKCYPTTISLLVQVEIPQVRNTQSFFKLRYTNLVPSYKLKLHGFCLTIF